MKLLYFVSLVLMLSFYFSDDNKLSVITASLSSLFLTIIMFETNSGIFYFMIVMCIVFNLLISISNKTFPALSLVKKVKILEYGKISLLLMFALILSALFILESSDARAIFEKSNMTHVKKIRYNELANILLFAVTFLPISLSALREGNE